MRDASTTLGRREILVQAVLLILLLACAFPATFFDGEMIAPGDLLFEIAPWKHYAPPPAEMTSNHLLLDALTAMNAFYVAAERALESGEWPLWNPLAWAGMPLLANCQSAVFYPPRLLHAVLDNFVATTFYILLKLWLCGMTAYVCARAIGLRVGPARFASVGWMLGSYNLLFCYWPLPDVSAWVPVLFLGVEFILAHRYRRGFYTTALGATLILLAGHPETAFAMSLAVGLYFLLRLAWERPGGRKLWMPIAVASAAWGLALLVYAVQLLPFLEYLANSDALASRADRTLAGRAWLPPSVAAAFWVPRFFGTNVEGNYWGRWNSNMTSLIYPGMAVWLCMGLLFPKTFKDRMVRGRVICLTATAAVCALVAFNTPLFGRVNELPVFNTMSEFYHIAFTLFALPLLAAICLDRWLAGPARLRQLGGCTLLVLVAALVVGSVYAFHKPLLARVGHIEYIHTQFAIAALFTTAGVVVLVARRWWNRPRILAAAMTLLLACDLLVAVRGINVTSPRKDLFFETELTRYLLGREQPCRVRPSMGLIPAGLLPHYGIEEWTGYDGMYPRRIREFQKRLKRKVWTVMEPVCAIPYYLHNPVVEPRFPRDEPGRFEFRGAFEGIEVYENRRAFPRAFLVGSVEAVPGLDAMFQRMCDHTYDPAGAALVEAPLPATLPDPPDGGLGPATVLERTASRVTVEAEASQDCVLVLADAYYPGWKAAVDGQATALFPVYHVFRGLVLPEGKHIVTYQYEPLSFRIGLLISTVTLIATIAVTLRRLLRRNPSAGRSST